MPRYGATISRNINYSGWNATGTKTGDPFTVWQRFRLRSDFIASEAVKFRFVARVFNKAWGNDTFTVGQPRRVHRRRAGLPAVQAAFHQRRNSPSACRIGPCPSPTACWAATRIFSGSRSAAAIGEFKFNENVSLVGGFTRMLDSNKDFDPTTTQKADELDGYFLSLPVTLDGFSATPWGHDERCGARRGLLRNHDGHRAQDHQ